MRLNQLHKAEAKDFALFEELSPEQEEKLSYVQMMMARQGQDPAPMIRRVRGLIDPGFAKQEGAKAGLKQWLGDPQTKAGAVRDGSAYGRKVRITVLESVVRDLITEGFFKNIGALIVQKLRSLVGGERQEHALVSQALDTYPGLAAIMRYANRAQTSVYEDPKFWQLVDQMTKGKANTVKRIVYSTFERLEESTEPYKGVLTECTIVEARVSQVLRSLGLDQDTVNGLMRQYKVRDEDYDISRLKGAYDQAKAAPGKLMAKGKEKVGEVVGKVKGAAADLGKDVGQEQRVREENVDFAEEVVKVAFALMQLEAADVESPQQASAVINQVMSGEPVEQATAEPAPEYEVTSPEEVY